MGTTVQAELSDEEYDRLDSLKDDHGLTWRGMLLTAEESLSD